MGLIKGKYFKGILHPQQDDNKLFRIVSFEAAIHKCLEQVHRRLGSTQRSKSGNGKANQRAVWLTAWPKVLVEKTAPVFPSNGENLIKFSLITINVSWLSLCWCPAAYSLLFLPLPLKHPVSATVCPSNASCPASISRETKQAGEHNEAAKEPDVYLSSLNSGQEEHRSEWMIG